MIINTEKFRDEIKQRKEYVERCLLEFLPPADSYPALIHEAMHYAVFNGGKRLRPIMVFEGAVLGGADKEEVITAACALELIHTYSLVHDDLPAMDNDEMRRGKPTCHIVYGEANAILTGDALLTAAFYLLAENLKAPKVKAENLVRAIRVVAAAAGSQGMIGGQVLDLQSEGLALDFSTLRKLHSLKTGQLFRAALTTGAILSGMKDSGIAALDKYAASFGLAFQITDDILDVAGNQDLIGKPIGSDAKNHKSTYVSLLGMEKSYRLARVAVESCQEALGYFGPEADFLRQLALHTLNRKN
ncbi:MAG: polyprenyl synthetase family protein [Syntrophomonadaceae bacterium]|jgi:geranylgeranyl diphosphate synthase type II|nr:polyprenyl synthetase family protein [Syntrophomonadaceae bacterium]